MGQTWTAMRTMMTYSQAQNRRDAVASAKLRLGSTEALKWYRLDDGIESVSSSPFHAVDARPTLIRRCPHRRHGRPIVDAAHHRGRRSDFCG